MDSPMLASDRIGALVSKELLDCLDEIYPQARAVPQPDDSERSIWIRVGERNLIDMLRKRYHEAVINPIL